MTDEKVLELIKAGDISPKDVLARLDRQLQWSLVELERYGHDPDSHPVVMEDDGQYIFWECSI